MWFVSYSYKTSDSWGYGNCSVNDISTFEDIVKLEGILKKDILKKGINVEGVTIISFQKF